MTRIGRGLATGAGLGGGCRWSGKVTGARYLEDGE